MYPDPAPPSPIPVFNLFGETTAFPDVIHCERIRDRALGHDWRISPHRHRDMVQVFHMARGSAEVAVDGRKVVMKDGDFLYIPMMAVHGFSFRQGAEGSVLSFPVTLVGSLASASGELAARLTRPVHSRAAPGMVQLVAELAEVFARSGIFRANMLITLAQAILVHVAEAAAQEDEEGKPRGHRHMTEFDRLLRRNVAKGWGVAEFARALNITPGHLNRLCRAATGNSAVHYVELARMAEASRLLAYTQMQVAEIGYRLGYEDPSYFSRRFRVTVGQTPSEYRSRFGA